MTTTFKVPGAVLASLAKVGAALESDDFAFTVKRDRIEVMSSRTGIAYIKASYPIAGGPEEPLVLHHSRKRFADKLDGIASEDEVEVSYDAPHMQMKAGRKRRVVVCIDARTAGKQAEPKPLPFVANVVVPLASVRDACASNDDYYDMSIRVTDGVLFLTAKDDLDTYEDSVPVGPDVPNCESLFSPKVLKELLAPAATKAEKGQPAPTVTLHLGNDLPLKMDYSLAGGGLAEIWLAPKVVMNG